MNNLTNPNSGANKRLFSTNFLDHQIIYCPDRNILESNLSLLQEKRPQLIVYDISQHFTPSSVQLSSVENIEEVYDLKNPSIFHDGPSLKEFMTKIQSIFNILHSILDDNGFVAVRVNGTLKTPVKQILDSIFNLDNFMNEVILNSPIQIQYTKEIAFFERTEYFLIYSASTSRKINPVFDEKESGGYWHSFVSKGQGSPKNFLIDGTLMLLDPPTGTHWKLKQESILKLCKKGLIRLNRRGNPEYWVLPKIGRIVDTNWLDLDINTTKKYLDSQYRRLFNVLLQPEQLLVLISPRSSGSLIEASKYGLRCICLIKDKKALEIMKKALTHEEIKFSLKAAEKLAKTPLEVPEIILEEKSSSQGDFSTLIPISSYPNYMSKDSQSEDERVNQLIWGDCFQVLNLLQLEFHQTIKLIYIDPPFYTGYDESLYIPFQGRDGSNLINQKIADVSLKTIAYKNILSTTTPIKEFKHWFRNRVTLMRPLLRLDGFIFVRFDYHFGHYAKTILDDVFGESNFVIEFIVRRMKKNLSEKQLNQQTHLIVHSDSLYVYRRSKKAKFRPEMIRKTRRKNQNMTEIEHLHDNLWIDIAGYQKVKRTIYPTENSESLLKRVIEISTSEGDLVADFFAGSGTTLVMAEKLERNWVGIDIGSLSTNEIRKRLLQLEERSLFEYHELNYGRVNFESEEDQQFEFEVKINQKKFTQGTKVILTLTNLVHSLPLKELEIYSYDDLIDYWEVDWNYNKSMATIGWYSHRKIKGKRVEKGISLSASHEYSQSGKAIVWVRVVDIFGNSSKKTIRIELK
ncbi:MAG: DNA methyltransferase [Candidatus Hodarchaeales archaeon]|jgi:DNA modification methylase